MNEELQKQLAQILSGIQSAAKATGDFAINQLPDIAQSYVLYGRVTSVVKVIVCLGLFIVFMFVALKIGYFNKTAVHKNYYDLYYWDESRFAAAVLGTAMAILAFYGLWISCMAAGLVWLAPKVWLLKELSAIIK